MAHRASGGRWQFARPASYPYSIPSRCSDSPMPGRDRRCADSVNQPERDCRPARADGRAIGSDPGLADEWSGHGCDGTTHLAGGPAGVRFASELVFTSERNQRSVSGGICKGHVDVRIQAVVSLTNHVTRPAAEKEEEAGDAQGKTPNRQRLRRPWRTEHTPEPVVAAPVIGHEVAARGAPKEAHVGVVPGPAP